MNLVRQTVMVQSTIHIYEEDGGAGEAVGFELRKIYSEKGFKYALSNHTKKNDEAETLPFTRMDISIFLEEPTIRAVELAFSRVRDACEKVGRQQNITMVFPGEEADPTDTDEAEGDDSDMSAAERATLSDRIAGRAPGEGEAAATG